MRARQLAAGVFAAIVATDLGYRVTFTARDNNSAVVVQKQCYVGARLDWTAYQSVPVEALETSVDVPMPNRGIRPGSRCVVVGFVFAWQPAGTTAADGNADPEYIVESTPYLEEQR